MSDIIMKDNTPEFKRALEEQVMKGLEAIGLQGEGNAKKEITQKVYNTPESKSGYVRTGNLRNSISHAVSKSEQAAFIGTNVEYAPFVEMGTSKMKARPFIKPAATEYSEEYKAIMLDALKNG